MAIIGEANKAFRSGNYEEALDLYFKIKKEHPELSSLAETNIILTKSRLTTESVDRIAAKYTKSVHKSPVKSKEKAPSHYVTPSRTPIGPSALVPALLEVSVDIVIPVYNALQDVKRCLNSVVRETDGFTVHVFLVNDGSDPETSLWLETFAESHSELVTLMVNETNIGYTKSINRGLKESRGMFIVTLNSDTIVTRGWIHGLVRSLMSTPKAGIAGPLSNAASWQSVPIVKTEDGAFAINQVPLGKTPEFVSRLVRSHSERRYPRVPFVNGFCFMMKKDVLKNVGYLDEERFPLGYGEENDYCIRAAKAGFELLICDDVYVYHAKSKSFGHETRERLSSAGGKALRDKHGADLFARYVTAVEEASNTLQPLRRQLSGVLSNAAAELPVTTGRSPYLGQADVALHPTPAFSPKDYQLSADLDAPVVEIDWQGPNAGGEWINPSIGIHLHLFYEDLKQEIAGYLNNIPGKFSLYISLPGGSATDELRIGSYFSSAVSKADVQVKRSPNRGRDIASFLNDFNEQLLGHDLIAHIHTKRSRHNLNKRDWRRQLLHGLLGSENVVQETVRLLMENIHLGIVFPEYHWSLSNQIGWGTNYQQCVQLANTLGLKVREDQLRLFPAGSMFWARPRALESILSSPAVTYENFPSEEGQIDGTLAHCVERLLGEVAGGAGYDILQTRVNKPHNLSSYHPAKWPYIRMSRDDEAALVRQYRDDSVPSNKGRVAVYTALTGGYDHLPHHAMLDSNCDYYVYSDGSIQGHDYLSQRSIPASVASASSTVQARTLKTMAPDLFQDYRFVVWIDANVLIRGELDKYIEIARQGEFPLYGIPHPMRNCAYEEAKAVIEAGKADRSAVESQMRRYRLEGYPPKNGLIETNFLILDMQHPSTRLVLDGWREEMQAGTYRDQLSINYVLWRLGLGWGSLMDEGMSLRDSADFAYFGHGRNSGYPAKPN